MRIRFFGDPWPSPERRAPICADDADRIPTPVGTKCLECTIKIKEGDRGVVTACSPAVWGFWTLEGVGTVASYHLKCWLEQTIGGEMSKKILDRMNLPPEERPQPRVPEDVQPGRGWSRRAKTGEGRKNG